MLDRIVLFEYNRNMKHGTIISIHYNERIGGRAEVYRIKGKPFENTYSIAYFNSMDARLRTEHFTNTTLNSIEAIAENWALGA